MSDLISREALKKKFDEYIKANPNISGIFELGKIIIDTAPTVEPERPAGDLISREALKKAVDTYDKFGYTAQDELIRLTEKNKDLYVPYVKYHDVVNCIDNTPTGGDDR